MSLQKFKLPKTMRSKKWIIIPFEIHTSSESYEGYLLKKRNEEKLCKVNLDYSNNANLFITHFILTTFGY